MREYHKRSRFSYLPTILVTFATIFILSACVSSGGHNTQPWNEKQNNGAGRAAEETPNDLSIVAVEKQNLASPQNGLTPEVSGLPPVKVAILLPLSGQHARLGEAMLNAAQMALFDVGHNNFTLVPKDTKGTPQGAREAARGALQDGAKLVLGPVFSPSVKAARQVTQSANVNMIAFSTDWTLANSRTFLLSFLPFDQVERVVSYATHSGYNRIGLISPTDSYGDGVVSAYNAVAARQNLIYSRVERFSPNGTKLTPTMRKFSDYDARKAAGNVHGAPFDAVLMPVGGAMARQIGSFLNHYDLPPRQVRRLGTGLMDDTSLASDKTLDGTWFAAPAPKPRQKFERRYHTLHYKKPPRIATLAYDATALAAILARTGLQRNNRAAFDHTSITNPNGFSGVDGIFRFRSDGIIERGLAILEYKKGKIIMIENAPRTFQQSAF
ncbi:MAG: penicillin-binding protein activator [Alphaproteobacteria bacterium]